MTRSAHTMDGRVRIGTGALLCLLLSALVMSAGLVFAGSAHALGTEAEVPAVTSAPAEEAQTPAVVTAPPEETAPVATTPAPTEAPAGSTTPPPAEETPPVVTTPAPEEAPVAVTPPPVEEPAPVAKSVTPPAEEPAPITPTRATPLPEEAQPSTQSQAAPAEPSASVSTQASSAQEAPANAVALPAGGPSTGLPIIAAALNEMPEASVAAAVGQASGEAVARQRARQSACELSLEPCGTSSPSPNAIIATPAVTFGYAAATAPWRPGVASSPGKGEGGSVGGGRPITPAPTAPPSGASGSGAPAGSSGGAAPSIFLTLAGLLLLAGPRATRRLRLLCRPWLTAFFVLIPERPG